MALIKGAFMTWIAYRFSFPLTLVGTLLYMALMYHMWGSIYRNSELIHGMSFNQAFVYLALASSLFVLFKTWTDWSISRKILDGSIIVDLIKPLDFQLQMLFRSAGTVLFNLTVITLPSALVLFFVFKAEINLGIGLAFFPVGLFFAFLISFTIDYIVGLSSFYTESLWGISMTKEIITSVLSGALIPLQFFPETALQVLHLLPFQAIYHIPLTMITSPNLRVSDYLRLLATQAFWVAALFVLSRLFYRKAIQVLAVGGG
jgi:ABC-2 type transport system permease protein